MSTQKPYNEAYSTTKKGKRKARHCDLEGYDNVLCDYEQHGASTVTDQIIIPDSSQHLELVNKALCRKHYNKYIVNARKKPKLTNLCIHPKHEIYLSTARNGGESKKLKKAPERLIEFFTLPKGARICHHCLYKTDSDPEYISLSNYPLAVERIPKENIKQFQGRSYVLRGDIIYSESEFQELESAYHEVCAELDETKLGN
jgi:hypothetical protein